MKVMIEYDIDNCGNCPFKRYHYGHGECWYECTHKDNGRGAYEDILWGCNEQFTQTPHWCPLPLKDKAEKPVEIWDNSPFQKS